MTSSMIASFSALLAALSLVLGIWLGPQSVFVISPIGLAVCVLSLGLGLRNKHAYARPSGFALTVGGVHLLLIVIAIALYQMFLSPLAVSFEKLPRFRHSYVDPDGVFSVRGPADWVYERYPGVHESGVTLRPAKQTQYIGVSEISILVRKLETKPKSSSEFLKTMASSWVEKKVEGQKLFDFKVEPAEMLNKEKGVWSTLDAFRLWVPVRQVTLIGLKNDRYLCSVSIIGLKKHAVFTQVLCLGLFETIRIGPAMKNN